MRTKFGRDSRCFPDIQFGLSKNFLFRQSLVKIVDIKLLANKTSACTKQNLILQGWNGYSVLVEKARKILPFFFCLSSHYALDSREEFFTLSQVFANNRRLISDNK